MVNRFKQRDLMVIHIECLLLVQEDHFDQFTLVNNTIIIITVLRCK